jgi:NAD(P)-dependent dehydrogenase (short-subunit alcohol dehydrogenase family)
VCQAVVPHMEARGGGKIINLVSVAGLRPSPGMGVYSVSKAAVIMLTQILAVGSRPASARCCGRRPRSPSLSWAICRWAVSAGRRTWPACL